MESKNEMENLRNKVQDQLENLNYKLEDYDQKYNQISLETKNNSRRSKKIKFNSINIISICVIILTCIIYNILKYIEPDLIKEKIKNKYEVSFLKLTVYSFVFSIGITIFLYFGYYFYIKWRV